MKRIRVLVAILVCAGPAAVASHAPVSHAPVSHALVSPDHPAALRLPLRNHPNAPTLPGVPATWDMLRKSDPATVRQSICAVIHGAGDTPERHQGFDPGQILSELQRRGMCADSAG